MHLIVAGVQGSGFDDGFAELEIEVAVPGGQETWYNHIDACGGGTAWMDKKAGSDYNGACGGLGTNPAGERLWTFSEMAASWGHDSGAPVVGTFWIDWGWGGVGEPSFCAVNAGYTFAILADGSEVASVSADLGPTEIATFARVQYDIDTTLSAAIPAGAKLSSTVDVRGTVCAFYTFGDAGQSFVTIGAADA